MVGTKYSTKLSDGRDQVFYQAVSDGRDQVFYQVGELYNIMQQIISYATVYCIP